MFLPNPINKKFGCYALIQIFHAAAISFVRSDEYPFSEIPTYCSFRGSMSIKMLTYE
ncbi:hypothetical protein BofuT4_uP129950.1 [Botrytis cinerea T4]|uniref:Uncharacterized protein n=1 Tax=Botryotinia fuckeliana (strain T4) TaxID=999810 RepID=G2YRP7_BOTF4|nr:hypothetical protein BofuT4_uP129950.1 [Botrytis cinerea T4]